MEKKNSLKEDKFLYSVVDDNFLEGVVNAFNSASGLVNLARLRKRCKGDAKISIDRVVNYLIAHHSNSKGRIYHLEKEYLSQILESKY